MKLVELETLGVRGLADAAYPTREPDGTPTRLVVVTGPPGAGSTTFLESIAFSAARLASSGPVPDPAQVLRVGGSVAAIRSAWWVDDDERRYGGLFEQVTRAQVNFDRGGIANVDADPGLLGLMSRYDHTPDTSKVVLFPARRVDDTTPGITDFEAAQRMSRLSPASAKYAGLQMALAARANDKATWPLAQSLHDELCPSAKLAGVNGVGQLEFTTQGGHRVPLFRLSFSERNAFVLAASVALMGLDRSVLLLDTPELGVPVGLAARWIDALRDHTPDAQWIVASRDPEVVGLAGKSGVVDLGLTPDGKRRLP